MAEIRRLGTERLRRAYDPERGLVGSDAPWAPGTRAHRPPDSLWLAYALLTAGEAGAAADLVALVLETQERSREHPHRGNFRWLADDQEVTDLNAVQFALRALLPLLLAHGPALPAPLLDHCRVAVRLALEEQERLAVAPTYTNIHLMALYSLLVGGQWLGDGRFADLGHERWDAWVAFTVGNGAPHEYNSPGYGATDLSALAALHQHVADPRVRLQARLLYERIWLHLALHLHRPTGQHAGPHSRCYWEAMTGGRSGLHDLLWRETGWPWLLDGGPPASVELASTEHWLPDAVRGWLAGRPGPDPLAAYEVRETANRAEGADLTTYFTPSYALGTASRTYGIGQDDYYIEHQANHLLLHYRRAGEPSWGMVYSRYVVNDRHRGTLSAAPDRPATANFYDQGNFAAVQQRGKAVALYALLPQPEPVASLKTVVVFPPVAALDEVWVDGRRVPKGALPRPVRLGEWVVVADGDVYIGVRPLEPSRLGREAPLVLERGPQGELWLSVYNYRGPAKRFWDYASLRGAFWRGNLRAGFALEVAERRAYRSPAALFDHLRRAVIRDAVAPTAASPALRTVTFTSGTDTLQLLYDLWSTAPGERRLGGEVYDPPALASPLAVQGSSGRLAVGQATLETAPQPVWLIAREDDAATRSWTAVNPTDRPTPLRLETPLGVLTAERWGLGRLEWHAPAGEAPSLAVDALRPPEGLRLPAGLTLRG
ncbi:MAG TPA: hypothetical protein VNK05_09985 [Chloroflexota bacterium]|nr:hypothetical protein [Chloroflexota bacterium]